MTTRKEVEEVLEYIGELYPEYLDIVKQGQKVDTLLSIFNLCEKYGISLLDIEAIVIRHID